MGTRPTPTPAATFVLAIDDTTLAVRDVALSGAPSAKGKEQEYRLRLTRGLTNDTTLVDAFRSRTSFTTAKLAVRDGEGALLTTYTLGDVAVVSFEHTGSSGADVLLEEVVLSSSSLAVNP
jgi:hypothetical protein